MRALHLRLISADPGRPDLAAFVAELRASGHAVVTGDDDSLSTGIPVIPDLVLMEATMVPPAESLATAEARHIAAILRFTNGNKRQSALLLGVARSTLLAKIRRYDL